MAKTPKLIAEKIGEVATDYAAAAGVLLVFGALAGVAAWFKWPVLAVTAAFFGFLIGIPLLLLRWFAPGVAEALLAGGALLLAVASHLPPKEPRHTSRLAQESPPVLIDKATGCEWIGTSWDHATPRIGPDGASICHGKSTGKPPSASRSPAG